MVTTQSQSNVLRYDIVGSRRFSNYGFAVIVAIGASGFLLAGLSSFLKINLLPISEPLQLEFVPQGLALSFYGVAGTLLELYLLYVMAIDYGSGYNEFDRNTGKVKIFRRGRSKNKNIEFTYKIADVQAVRVEIRNGLSPKRSLYLRVKGKGDLPLSEVGQPIALAALEDRAAEIAKFLSVPLEGL
ncbi:photosystem I assembly protein Ycf4 [Pseudanabaena sp. 'Roaring Creek']|uniref:photosystem I assembly protein Ycf4 n=1 Tax=Pseudanabaena sp. 'Roaring Creek' TaxID=1681830 RepID=UPI0006D7CFBC|nr:photosystem I assembly protein Ycf4 [Pseudanabaena sp. 'Roaring Creek']